MTMERLIATGLGLGWLPIAPGTWGSLPPAVLYGILFALDVPPLAIFIVMLVFAAVTSLLCVKTAPASITATGKKDPGEVVLDEMAGQSLAYILAFNATSVCPSMIGGFILFRVFDIIKPWPARKLEKLPSGWGVLCDDLMAGIYAAIVLYIAIKHLFPYVGCLS